MKNRISKNDELYQLIPIIPELTDIISEYVGNPFTIVVNINNTVIIPYIISEKSSIIDWGDGVVDNLSYNTADVTHTYACSGKYTISIFGDITYISFKCVNQLVDISHWGNLRLQQSNDIFRGCKNLVSITARDVPNLTATTNLSHMFYGCIKLIDADLSKWDVSNITKMVSMFMHCELLDADVSRWDVSNVTDMANMFDNCHNFNSDISNWDVSNVTNMEYMFDLCNVFDRDLSKWNVSNVRSIRYMFHGCEKFNSNLNEWDISNVFDMRYMFSGCEQFNSELNKWNVSNVNNMSYMFYGCKIFNSDLSKWDVSNVNNMARMF